MTRRYFVCNPRQTKLDDVPDWWTDETDGPVRTVYEPEPGARPTGILDHHGYEIMVADERAPIGFRLKPSDDR